MHRLYEPNTYYQRIRIFLDAHHNRGPAPKLTWPDVGAALRSLWLMGFVYRGRRAYWRFLVSTLARHPSQFGVAMTLAIMGHHFRIVAAGL